MKKLFSLLMCLLTLTAVSMAQSTTPRFGTSANDDNTGRILTYKFFAKTDATAADTMKVTPSAYSTTLRLTMTDSIGVQIRSTATSFAGDEMQVIATGASGTKVKFIGTNFQAASSSATLSSGGTAVVKFVFTGSKWAEVSRVVQ